MVGRICCFSIHNIVRLKVVDKSNLLQRTFDTFFTHYENFINKYENEDFDLIIEIGKFQPDIKDKYIVGGGKYYIGNNYLYVHNESYKGAKWSFEVNNFDGHPTVVKIDCNPLGRIFITGNVIDFMIHLKLLQKSHPIIHASAISKNNKAFLFSCRGGGGKTTIALRALSDQVDLLGDNFSILNDGKVLSFPTSLSVFSYNLVPRIKENLTLKERESIRFKNVIYKLTRGYAKFFTKVNPKKVTQSIPKYSYIDSVFLIRPIMQNTSDVKINRISRNDAIEEIRYNQMLEFPLFNRYLDEYSYFQKEKILFKHWESYQNSLDDNLLKAINFYQVILNNHSLQDFVNILNSSFLRG